MNWDLLFSKYIYYLNFVVNGLFIYGNIINLYIFENLIGNINNIYCLITHSWWNPKFFDYKINNLPRGSKHMQVLSQTHYLSLYLISLQNSCLLFIVALDVQGLSNGKECQCFIFFTKPRSWKKSEVLQRVFCQWICVSY